MGVCSSAASILKKGSLAGREGVARRGIRLPDPLLKRQTLYPTELRVHR
jgi:hypothetical protein